MVAVITGDLINSSERSPRLWLKILKRELNAIGKSPSSWQVYRGDSFQLLVPDPSDALRIAIKIKVAIKTIDLLDVRMAIGLGEKDYNATKITEANGPAFIHSGEQFELLKKEKVSLALKSGWELFDQEMNLYLKLVLDIMDSWTVNTAEIVKLSMEHPEKSQKELGEMIGIRQNTVSERLTRAYYKDIMEVIDIYRIKLKMQL
jgi:hypothetical protein